MNNDICNLVSLPEDGASRMPATKPHDNEKNVTKGRVINLFNMFSSLVLVGALYSVISVARRFSFDN